MDKLNGIIPLTEETIRTMLAAADRHRLSGDMDSARSVCRQILECRPAHADTMNYLGLIEFHDGNHGEAIRLIREAIRHNPGIAAYHNNIGNILYRVQRYTEAKDAFIEALRLNPDDIMALLNYAWLLGDEGHTGEARQCYQQIIQKHPVAGVSARLAMLIPPISGSVDGIKEVRENFRKQVVALADSDIRIQDPFCEVGATNFYLAYHGENNRELQSLVARFYIKACPGLLYTAPHCQGLLDWTPEKRIRIGFISRFFTDHSIGKTTRGLIAGLDRNKFSVTVFFLDPPAGRIGKIIESSADESVVVPNKLDAARQCIAARELHILLYPDIGMESFTYYLAYSRLAPVQCTSFGHPDTTGIPNIDYFISTQCYETDRAEEHYSEKLVRLQGVSSLAYYKKPEVPDELKERAYFGLSDDENIYICPQHLFKFHPDFDAILAGILRADENGRIVIIDGQHAHWGRMLRDRFHAVMPDVHERVRFVPRQAGPDFINIIAVSDVMLDTIYFCGQNTSHEGLAVGTPIVTLPGELHRSRHTMCFLKAIGIDECIARDARDYIQIAVRLGTDPDYRAGIKAVIQRNSHLIWEEKAVISEHERFFTASLVQKDLDILQRGGSIET